MHIYLDTNAFIAAVEGREDSAVYRAVWELFALSERRDGFLVTSELSLAELLVKPLEAGLTVVVNSYLELLGESQSLFTLQVTRDILISAAYIRKEDKSIKLPDAIHLATADRAECSVILTNDQRLIAKRPDQCRAVAADAIERIMQEVA